MATKKIHVHIIQTALDDGSLAFKTPATADILAVLNAANNVYKTADIEFVYDPSDFEIINSTRLQQDVPDGEDRNGIEITRQTLAGWWYGKLVIFLREFPNDPTHYKSANESSYGAEHVVLSSLTSFSHEVGHYFNLFHTHNDGLINTIFGVNPFSKRLEFVGNLLKEAVDSGKFTVENALNLFDGDGLSDTPPDAGPPIFQPNNKPEECATPPAPESVSIKVTFKNNNAHTYVIKPAKDNVMSYFPTSSKMRISNMQGVVIANSLNDRRKHLVTAGDWKSFQPLGGEIASAPAVVSRGAQEVNVFVRGKDNQVWQNSYNGKDWTGLLSPNDGFLVSSAPAALYTTPNRIDIFARGMDGQLWHKWSIGKGKWQIEHLDGEFQGTPGVISRSEGTVDVFVRRANNKISQGSYVNSKWSGLKEHQDGFLASSSPAIVSFNPDHLDLYARGTDNQLWHKWWIKGQENWQLQALGGKFSSDPAVISRTAGTVEVFVRGMDNQIWQNGWDGYTWSNFVSHNDGFLVNDTPSIISWNSRHLDLYAQGTDKQLWHKWRA